MVQKYRSIVFTWNNYNENDLHHMKSPAVLENVKYIIFGREIAPTTETPHLQGFVYFKSQKTYSAVKKLFKNQAVHLEPKRGTFDQAIDYCKKEDKNYFEYGEKPKEPIECGKYGGDKWDEVCSLAEQGRFAEIPRSYYIRYYNTLYNIHKKYKQQLVDDKFECPEIELRPWQLKLKAILDGPVDKRKIYFVHDEKGNAGKSTFATWLEFNYDNVTIQRPAKGADMAYAYDPQTKIFILDVPRSKTDHCNWTFLEEVKDRRVFSSKYESESRKIEFCHVIVMCNDLPPRNAFSEDRWEIITV